MKDDIENRLLKTLETEPSDFIEFDVSNKVIQKIRRSESSEAKKMVILYFIMISAFLLLSVLSLIYFLGVDRFLEIQSILLIGFMVGGVLLLVQWLDYKLVRKRRHLFNQGY